MNLMLNRVPLSTANPTWSSACSYNKATHAGDSVARPTKTGGIDRQLKLLSDEMPGAPSMLQTDSIKMLSFEGNTPRVFSQGIFPCYYIKLFVSQELLEINFYVLAEL
jgi:hypothetical protein